MRRLLARELARLPAGESVHADRAAARPERRPRRPPSPAAAQPRRDVRATAVVFRVNLGAKDNADPRWLLPLICRRGGVTRREVGAIRIGPHETTFEIAGGAARDYAEAAAELDPRAPHVVIAPAAGGATAPPAPHHPQKRRDGFSTYAPKRETRSPPPHAKPHPEATPQPQPEVKPQPHPHAKAHPPAKPHPHAKPQPHAKHPHPPAQRGPKHKHRKG